MVANYSEIADLIISVNNDDIKNKIVDISPTLLRAYPAVNKLMRKSVYRQQNGSYHRWPVNLSSGTGAINFGPYAIFDREVGDTEGQARMFVRGTQKDYSFDMFEEYFNSGGNSLVDHIRVKRQNAKIQLVAKHEAQFWGNAAYADRASAPQGMLYWLPYTAAAVDGTANFVGTYPTSYTEIAEIDPVVNTGWKSYGDQYVAPTVDDLVDKITLAMSHTLFLAPISPMEVQDLNSGYEWGIYCNLDTERALDKECKNQNDNIGSDLDRYHGKAMIRGTPLVEVPFLAANARDPVFGINWGVTKNHVLRDLFLKQYPAPRKSDQPFVVTMDIISMQNILMYNRRVGGFNISKAA